MEGVDTHSVGAKPAGVTLKAPSEETFKNLMELAGLAAMLIGGPYAHGAVIIFKLLNSLQKDYEIDPEFEKYFESLERLTEAYNRRHGIKGGKI